MIDVISGHVNSQHEVSVAKSIIPSQPQAVISLAALYAKSIWPPSKYQAFKATMLMHEIIFHLKKIH